MIRLTIPTIEEDDLQAVREVLESGYLVQGPRVAAFEQAIARYVGVEHSVAVSNCTAALHLALLGLGVGPGDSVAVCTYSWPATANVIVLCGAKPVFVDIQRDTYNMDPDSLGAALRRNRCKAVLPVHTFGGMADMKAIVEVAQRYGVPVIEDAACALGADLNGRKAGTWGVMGCFSFHPRKAITTGEGGVITTNDPTLARQLRILRNHGLDPDAPAPDFVAAGYNLRLTEFQAALGTTQLQKAERIIEKRRAAARQYDAALPPVGMAPPAVLAHSRHVYQSYVALLPVEEATHRTTIITGLKEQGIECAIGTYHMPLTTFFRSSGAFQPGQFPVTDDVAGRAITLPLFESITTTQIHEVVSALAGRLSTV